MPQIPGSGIADSSISATKIAAGTIVAGIVDGTVIQGGTLIAYGNAGTDQGQILVYNGQPAAGNLIGSWSGAAGTDEFGNTFPLGLSVTSTSIEGTDFILNTSGLFYYNGTPALGNPPILSIVTSGITVDPFGNTVAALLTIGNYAGAHVAYDIMGNGFLYDPTDTLRIVLANGSATFSGITDPSIIFYNAHGAVILVVDQVAGGIFQYEDLGSASQGALILSQSGKNTTDPVTSETILAGVTLANATGNQLTQITSANGRIRFNNVFGAAVSVIAPDLGGIFFYNDLGSAVQGGAIGALVWSLSPVVDPIASHTFNPGTTSLDPIAAGFLFYDPANLFMGNAASMATFAHINGIGQGPGSASPLYTGIYGPTSAFPPGNVVPHAVIHVGGASPDNTHPAQVLLGSATGTADPVPITTSFLEVQGAAAFTGPVSAITGGAVETWHAMNLLAGWTNTGGVTAPAQYRLEPDNSVWLTGDIGGGTIASGTIIATLPAGYRTSGYTINMWLGIFAGASVAQTLSPSISLDVAGNVAIHNVPANTTRIGFDGKIPLVASAGLGPVLTAPDGPVQARRPQSLTRRGRVRGHQ